MRNFLFGLSLTLGALQTAFGACADTTIELKSGTPGFDNATKVYTPGATNAINGLISGCTDAAITIRLKYTGGDTIILNNEIIVSQRSGKTTRIVGQGANDSILTLVEQNTADPQLVNVNAGNTTVLTNLGFARKGTNISASSVLISADNSSISDCHFWMADNSSGGTGPLLDITGSSVLVERCLFRAPIDGSGRAVAIHTGGSANRVEFRSNVFFSTSLYLTAAGAHHVFANTFTGSKNDWNAIVVGTGVLNPGTNINIQHNLFAHKIDTVPPIFFGGAVASSDSILANAWSRGKANLPLAVSASSGTNSITLNGNSGSNVNTPLPRGFSNYGPASAEIKDYPLTQLRSNTSLVRNHPDFGKMFRVFPTSNWSSMSDIKDVSAGRLYFPNFTPFFAGKSWGTGVKVGAFVDADTYETPAPLDSGARGSALSFSLYGDSTQIQVTKRSFDANYYKTSALTPEFMYYFFSDTLSKLAANDTTSLKASTRNTFIRRTYLGDDGILTVPKEVRNDGHDVFVKLLHFRQGQQAPVRSEAGIATVSRIPSFPINDLKLTVDPASDFSGGNVTITVSRGTEAIESVRVYTATPAGQVVDSTDKAATGSVLTFNFPVKKGTFLFYAVPLAKLNGVTKSGQATLNSAAYPFQVSQNDTVYVSYKSGSCTGADGSASNAYCSMDSALNEVSFRKATTIIVKNGGVPMEDITITPKSPADTSALTITTLMLADRYETNRPIFRGKTKEALTITRKNVTLKGFLIEMPVGSTNNALNVKASGALIDGNIFRAASPGAVEGAAVNIDVGATGEMRFINNLVWAFTKNVQINNTASGGVRVMNNTFVEVASLNAGKGTGINLVGTGSVAAVFANNYFSGLTNPIDVSLTNKNLPLDHNVFTSKPALQGNSENGLDLSSVKLGATDIWDATYWTKLEGEFESAIQCSGLSPCNPMYAGSSSNTYNTIISTDVFGKKRKNKMEVGAYEFNSPPSWVNGVLGISLQTTGNYQKINFTVTGKTFDPTEAESVFVFWSTSPLNAPNEATVAGIPNSRKKSFDIAKLGSGSFSDSAVGIEEENTMFYFYAALFHMDDQTKTPKLGFAYSDSIRSDFNKDTSDCNFSKSNSICPSPGGVFVPTDQTYSGFQTRITMTEPVTGGTFKNPKFTEVKTRLAYNLDLGSPLPMITFEPSITGLGATGSQQRFTAAITLDGTPDLSDKELFLIPNDAEGMAQLVTAWNVKQANGKTTITIESNLNGTQQYAFGQVQASAQPPVIQSTDAAPPVFDFTAAKDSSVLHIPVKIKGSGFMIGNPLVLVSVVPAGGMVSGVLNGKFHSRTVALTRGYADLKDSLKNDRFYRYYRKALAAEAASPALGGHNKSFVLDSVSQDEFTSATDQESPDLSLAGGNLDEVTVLIPVSKEFREQGYYADGKAKSTRSLEVVFSVFDGARLSRSRTFIRTRFGKDDVHVTEGHQFDPASHSNPRWNLFGYPWEESKDPNLARIVRADKWDNDHARLMQYKGTGRGASAFDIYDGSNASLFKIDSGHAVWSGSTGPYTPASATGMSLDYQTFNLSVTPGQWNDFSLPFNFPILWKDILDSSAVANESDLPAWRYNPTTKSWDPLTKGSASPAIAGSVLHPWEGFSAHPTNSVTAIKFPLLDSARSVVPSAPKAAAKNDGSWTARVQAFDGTASMFLRIGKGNTEAVVGEAPEVPGQDFRVALTRGTSSGEVKVSQFIQAQDGSWQGHWALSAEADKDVKGIGFRLAEAGKNDIPIYLVDVLHNSVAKLSADAPVEVSGEALRANDYHVVAGDDEYLQSVLKGLIPLHLLSLSNYPNPFNGATLIRYALPESFGKVTFNLKVRDFRGRTVWEKTIQGGNSLSYMWDGRDKLSSPLPAGVYTLSLEAAAVGKPVFRANRRMLRM
jgi:hypothetical protein